MSGKFDQLTEITPALRRYAYSLTGNQQRADDLVQDCLERALRKLRFKRASAPLRPWLFRMMRNIHIDTWRKGRREIDHSMKWVRSLPKLNARAIAASCRNLCA